MMMLLTVKNWWLQHSHFLPFLVRIVIGICLVHLLYVFFPTRCFRSRNAITRLATLELNSNKNAGPASEVLFFNRVPKCGSEMLVALMLQLQSRNHFHHIRLSGGHRRKLTAKEQSVIRSEVSENSNHPGRISFDRHVYFIENLGDNVKWINLIRHPIERMISRFYYARLRPELRDSIDSSLVDIDECLRAKGAECQFLPGHSYDLTIPYFCGHEDFCTTLGDENALKTAKERLLRDYTVVGILEDLPRTFSALAKHLPEYFAGISQLYGEERPPLINFNPIRPASLHLPPDLYAQVARNLSMEIEFYEFARRVLRGKAEG